MLNANADGWGRVLERVASTAMSARGLWFMIGRCNRCRSGEGWPPPSQQQLGRDARRSHHVSAPLITVASPLHWCTPGPQLYSSLDARILPSSRG